MSLSVAISFVRCGPKGGSRSITIFNKVVAAEVPARAATACGQPRHRLTAATLFLWKFFFKFTGQRWIRVWNETCGGIFLTVTNLQNSNLRRSQFPSCVPDEFLRKSRTSLAESAPGVNGRRMVPIHQMEAPRVAVSTPQKHEVWIHMRLLASKQMKQPILYSYGHVGSW
jgi:hypothetical protein